MAETEEEKYEAIDIVIKAPAEGDSWFDKIFDYITSFCGPHTEDSEEFECSCGLQTMGGHTGTIDQVFDQREQLAPGVFPIDIAKAIIELVDTDLMSPETFSVISWARNQMKFEEWFANLPNEEEEEEDE